MSLGKTSNCAEGRRIPHLLALALGVALALGLLPGTLVPAYADTYYAGYVPTATDTAAELATKAVKFNGIDWYIIKDESTAVNAGTVTLFAKDNIATGQKFADSSNSYNGSSVKTYLDGLLTAESALSFKGVANAIDPVTLTTYKYNSTTEVAETTPNAKLWLLSTQEAQALPSDAVRLADGGWWLRSPGYYDGDAAFVLGDDGDVND